MDYEKITCKHNSGNPSIVFFVLLCFVFFSFRSKPNRGRKSPTVQAWYIVAGKMSDEFLCG